MFKKSKKGYYYWDEFYKLGVVNGFSTKAFGDMNRNNPKYDLNLEKFCKILSIDKSHLVAMEQVHGDKVYLASKKDLGSVIDNADGLICQEDNAFLICKSADCIPVLFFDKLLKIVGIAHVGWKGAYKEIVKTLVSQMIERGSKAKNILVGIGPSIRDCCYSIDKDRAEIFVKKFQKWKEKILSKKHNNEFLSLQKLIQLQLLSAKLLKNNIIDSTVCTVDNNHDFYSYRWEKENNRTKRFLTVIGIK